MVTEIKIQKRGNRNQFLDRFKPIIFSPEPKNLFEIGY